MRATTRIPRSWSDPKTQLLWEKKPTYEWRWERDRADWGLDYVGEGSTGVRGHNPPRFSLTSKPPASCAWDEWGLKPPAEPKSGLRRTFRILTSPPEENRKKKKRSERRSEMDFCAENTPPAFFPQPTPTKRESGRKRCSHNFMHGRTFCWFKQENQTAISGESRAGRRHEWREKSEPSPGLPSKMTPEDRR